MRTLAVLVFIAGVAAAAIALARQPTVAKGHVLEAELLEQLREHGVTGIACDREIPIGAAGAVFTCVATLVSGSTETVEYTMDREGALTASVKSATDGLGRGDRDVDGAASQDDVGERRTPGTKRIPASGDPWAN